MGAFSLLAAVPLPPVLTTVDPCGLGTGLPCRMGTGAAGAAAYIQAFIVPAMESVFLALAVAYFFYYAIRLMLESEEDSVVSETKSSYGYAIAGAVIVSMSGLLVQAVGPGFGVATTTLINDTPIISGLTSIILFIRLMISAAVSAAIVFQGFRMVVLQGDEGELGAQKKRFFNGLIGVAVVTLGSVIVDGFLPSTSGPGPLVLQIVGICNYLLQIFGALCILAFLAAGFMLVISTDESLKDRAKKTMFTTTISLIVVLCCLVILKFVVIL